jgi:hypothetical protein
VRCWSKLAQVLRYPRLQKLFGLSYVVVLQMAVSGEADVICTLDRDFYADDTLSFCVALGIDVCSDVELAGRISGRT